MDLSKLLKVQKHQQLTLARWFYFSMSLKAKANVSCKEIKLETSTIDRCVHIHGSCIKGLCIGVKGSCINLMNVTKAVMPLLLIWDKSFQGKLMIKMSMSFKKWYVGMLYHHITHTLSSIMWLSWHFAHLSTA